jgi:uncharacterized tellurite resistance protein B-like protein
MFRDLLQRIATPRGRDQVIEHLREILNADASMTADEHDFLEQYTLILRQASTVELLVGRLKTLFRKAEPENTVDLDEFIRNKILFKLRRRLGADQITPEMHRLCLLGGLMGIVAHADGDFHGRETGAIRSVLQSRHQFSEEALDVLMALIEEETVRGLDRSRLVAQLFGNATFDEKVEALDLMFAVATADEGLTHAELETLRGIASAMNLSHRQYIDAKVRARTKA